MIGKLRQWARSLTRRTLAIYLIARDQRTPRSAKWLAVGLLIYLLSPVDLIPDPLPLLGWVDDLVLLPVGLGFLARLLPPGLWGEAQTRAEQMAGRLKRAGCLAGIGIGLVWLILIVGLIWWIA